MFNNLHLHKKPPASAEEAAQMARQLIQTAGVTAATVALQKNASVPGQFEGAEIQVTLPLGSLQAALHQAAVAAAAEQGVKISQTTLSLSQNEPHRLHLHLSVEAKVFGGTMNLGVQGDAASEKGTRLRFSGFKMEGGGGMLGGIASAMILPKLAALEAASLDFEGLVGVPMELTQFTLQEEALILTGTFLKPGSTKH
jgi:hypothetical protein